MVNDFTSMMKDLKISPDEVDRFKNAFDDPEFKEIFLEYVKELQNPENKQKYESEIAAMEAQRGIDAKFLHPEPRECFKTAEHSSRRPVWVNIACNSQLEEAKCERDENKKGFMWSFPHSMTPPREELAKNEKVQVFDVVFHPNTYRMGESNDKFMNMLRETALDAIRKSFDVVLDKKYDIDEDQKYFGTPTPTLMRSKMVDKKPITEADIADPRADVGLRKDLEKFIQEKRAKSKSTITGQRTRPGLREIVNANGTVQPEYDLKHQKNSNLQDFVGQGGAVSANRPDNLVITIKLPKLKVTKNIKLDVLERSLTLKTQNEEPNYELSIELPYKTDSSSGANAKFSSANQTLEVTLPVVVDSQPDAMYIHPNFLPEIKTPNGGSSSSSNKENRSDVDRIKNEPRVRKLFELIPSPNLILPDFKASESERWCLFEVTVGHDVQCECKITHDGFTIRSNYEQGREQIGLAISVGREGVDMQESQKINSEGFFEIKLRKPRPGLLKHYWMGKTQRNLDYFRFDALISDRQVLGGFLSLEIFPISFKLPN